MRCKPLSSSDAMASVQKMHRRNRGKGFKLVRLGELLYLDRDKPGLIDVRRPDTYLKPSRIQRDMVTRELFGSVSRSNREWDDIIVPRAEAAPLLTTLVAENHRVPAQVEAHIYALIGAGVRSVRRLIDRCTATTQAPFSVAELLAHCRRDDQLRRQMPSIFEIIAYATCATIVDALHIDVALTLAARPYRSLRADAAFCALVGCRPCGRPQRVRRGRLERVSVTNAADGGLDFVSNFGLSVQVKYCELSCERVEAILRATAVNDLLIVCRSAAPELIESCQADSRIRGVITEDGLVRLADRIVPGKLGSEADCALRNRIADELRREFPGVAPDRFDRFYEERGYHNVPEWVVAA